MDHSISIRPECLRPAASGWVKPTGPEIREIIQRAGFTQSEAARLLGWGRNTLTRKLKELAMDDIDDQE